MDQGYEVGWGKKHRSGRKKKLWGGESIETKPITFTKLKTNSKTRKLTQNGEN
jgi:hypothetical protein